MYITRQIVKRYGWLVTYTKFWIREFKTLTSMPIFHRLKMWWLGFFSAAYYRYEFYLGKEKTRDYVSDYQENLRASRINAEQLTTYVDNKLIFPLFFQNFAPVVKNFAFISSGKVIPQNEIQLIDSFSKVISLAKNDNDLIVKPVGGQRGGKVNTVKFRDGHLLLNDRDCDEPKLIKFLQSLDFYLISPRVKQSAYSEAFYPRTTNTVRILTIIDPDTEEAFIAHAVQRIGTKHSHPVDNFAVGGLTCNIDISTGTVERGSYIIPTESKKTWYSVHPETGAQIEGVKIPGWEKIRSGILQVASSVPFLKIIGWDLIITDDEDGFVLLEGNNAPCFKVHQLHGGFLKDERIKKFMKHYRVIR